MAKDQPDIEFRRSTVTSKGERVRKTERESARTHASKYHKLPPRFIIFHYKFVISFWLLRILFTFMGRKQLIKPFVLIVSHRIEWFICWGRRRVFVSSPFVVSLGLCLCLLGCACVYFRQIIGPALECCPYTCHIVALQIVIEQCRLR